MKTGSCISQKNAHSLSMAIVTARLFTAMTIDNPQLGNSAWISIIAGMVLNLPLALLIDLRKKTRDYGILYIAARLIILVIAVLETTAVLGLIIDTIHCTGLLEAKGAWISAAALGVCLYALFKGGSGICNAARISAILAVPVIAVIILGQFNQYRPSWLLPLFGNGIKELAGGSVTAAGYIAAAPLIHTISEKDGSWKDSCCSSVIIASVAASILCVLRGMMAPVLVDTDQTRFSAIDMLVANGRVNLSLQLPQLFMLHGGYILTLVGYSLLAYWAIRGSGNNIPEKISAVIVIALVILMSMIGFPSKNKTMLIAGWEFPAAALAVIGMVCIGAGKKKKLKQYGA